MHFFDFAEHEIHRCFHDLRDNPDESMLKAAAAAMEYVKTLPDSDYSVPEKSPAKSDANPVQSIQLPIMIP